MNVLTTIENVDEKNWALKEADKLNVLTTSHVRIKLYPWLKEADKLNVLTTYFLPMATPGNY